MSKSYKIKMYHIYTRTYTTAMPQSAFPLGIWTHLIHSTTKVQEVIQALI